MSPGTGTNGSWRGFRLIPDDVLFFRDGRPATRGDDHYLPSIFPPHPSTLYGAVRTRRLLDEGVDLSKLGPDKGAAWRELPEDLSGELGDWGGFGSLEVRGPWLVRDETEILVPVPADLGVTLAPRPAARGRREPPRPRVERVARFLLDEGEAGEAGGHSHPLGLLSPYERKGAQWVPWDPPEVPPRPARGWYLTASGFDRWASGGAPEPGELVHEDELWVAEPRVGVAIEAETRSARDGHLFTFGFVRLREQVSLGFEARSSRLAPERRVRLGGEGRTCWLTGGPPLPGTPAAAGERLRLVAATPLLSTSGGWPPGFSEEQTEAALGERRVRLRAACVPGHVKIGGWNLAKGEAKALRRAVPAGSVFSIEAADDGGDLDAPSLHGTNHSDIPGEHLAQQGFGLLLAGAEPRASS